MPPRPDVSEERRAQIIEAALACFLRNGFTNTTMDDIVQESGLSKGAIYWYFKSKDEIFHAAITLPFQVAGEETVAALMEQETVAGQLRAGARTLVDLARQVEGYFGLFLEYWAQSKHREEAGHVWIELLEQYADLVAAMVEEGVRRGEFRPVDAKALVWAILATYDGLAAYAMFVPDLELEQISESFVETLIAGLLVEKEDA